MCHMSVEKAKTDQVDPKILQILDTKSMDGVPPPCIFETLQNIIKKIPLRAPFPILPEVTSRYAYHSALKLKKVQFQISD